MVPKSEMPADYDAAQEGGGKRLTVSAHEVAEILRRIARREIVIEREYGDWEAEVFPAIRAAGWGFTFFNDAADLDYLDSAETPDGRRAEYDDWWDEIGADPICLLTLDDQAALRRALAGE